MSMWKPPYKILICPTFLQNNKKYAINNRNYLLFYQREEREDRERLEAEQARIAREAEEYRQRIEKQKQEEERMARIQAGVNIEVLKIIVFRHIWIHKRKKADHTTEVKNHYISVTTFVFTQTSVTQKGC